MLQNAYCFNFVKGKQFAKYVEMIPFVMALLQNSLCEWLKMETSVS